MDGLRDEIFEMFDAKSREMGLVANLDLNIIEDAPIVGEFVYGEAFPGENRIWLEVVGPDASDDDILETICHELLHIKYPQTNHNSEMFLFKELRCKQYLINNFL